MIMDDLAKECALLCFECRKRKVYSKRVCCCTNVMTSVRVSLSKQLSLQQGLQCCNAMFCSTCVFWTSHSDSGSCMSHLVRFERLL